VSVVRHDVAMAIGVIVDDCFQRRISVELIVLPERSIGSYVTFG
jgi:hypothetical protein